MRTTRTNVSTLIARLTRVRRIHESDTDARVTGFVLNSASKSCKRPIVEMPIHPLSVVQMFADVRQIFENDNRVLEGTDVLDRLTRCLLDNICESVLVVVELFLNALLGVSLLETAERREHLFAEVSGTTTVVDVRLGWSTVPKGTARQEFGFANIEPDIRRLVWFSWLRNLVLDSNVKRQAPSWCGGLGVGTL